MFEKMLSCVRTEKPSHGGSHPKWSRPKLEALEDRCLPDAEAVVAASTLDPSFCNPSYVEYLRECLAGCGPGAVTGAAIGSVGGVAAPMGAAIGCVTGCPTSIFAFDVARTLDGCPDHSGYDPTDITRQPGWGA
jgi:hypothetical protein